MITSSQLAALLIDSNEIQACNVQSLPLPVCSLLAKILPASGLALNWRQALAARLAAALEPPFITTLSLEELAAAIDGLRSCQPQKVNGLMAARLTASLVAAEVAVGGPYRAGSGEVTLGCNIWVAECLRWLARPLPNLESYLAANIAGYAGLDADDALVWVLLHNRTFLKQQAAYGPLIAQALCLRIYYDYQQHLAVNKDTTRQLARQVHEYSRCRLPVANGPFGRNTRQMLEQVIQADTNHEISQLAWYFASSLVKPALPQPKIYLHLGAANLYAWAAYTIYDDFLDDEGYPPMLATANYSLRAMLQQYQLAVEGQAAYRQFLEATLTTVDRANSLETSCFRIETKKDLLFVNSLPDYGDCDMLADRALFHILGPMAVLSLSGQAKIGDVVWQTTLRAFRHYLIARQLNDDIHDWAQDLQAGQASYAVVELLRYLNLPPGSYRLSELLPYAKQQFWQFVLPGICDVALRHIRQARHYLLKNLELTSHNRILALFDYVEQSMHAALARRNDSQVLIQTFRLNRIEGL